MLATTPVTAPSVDPASPSTEMSALAETDESLFWPLLEPPLLELLPSELLLEQPLLGAELLPEEPPPDELLPEEPLPERAATGGAAAGGAATLEELSEEPPEDLLDADPSDEPPDPLLDEPSEPPLTRCSTLRSTSCRARPNSARWRRSPRCRPIRRTLRRRRCRRADRLSAAQKRVGRRAAPRARSSARAARAGRGRDRVVAGSLGGDDGGGRTRRGAGCRIRCRGRRGVGRRQVAPTRPGRPPGPATTAGAEALPLPAGRSPAAAFRAARRTPTRPDGADGAASTLGTAEGVERACVAPGVTAGLDGMVAPA